jgi:hypothetical protein
MQRESSQLGNDDLYHPRVMSGMNDWTDVPAHRRIFGCTRTEVPANGGAQAIFAENLPDFGAF